MEENEEFENLCNAQVCFLKLETMKISSCRKLKSVFPVALARMLPRLSTLQISYSDQLKEVFRKSSEEGTSSGKEIEVPNLKELKLRKLSSFVGICPGLKLHAVNLLKMDIDDCPEFALTFEATQVIPHHSTIEVTKNFS
ncbi:hypothetical protein L6164_023968 [Bauhinia variegata]|uniref:Uncharacterized protein n=1 Tax=Bauhinia variegata TaxID=167791 RepID=A0ACB9LW05_BAUVA|nr:hypothetical protein L6164_023968 [Bauhinia variegata]